VVDLGGGALKLSENIISIDIYDYKSVDVICDAQSLPFKNNSLDVVISRSLLEHVIDPLKIISEIDRCLKKNGYTAHLIPFMMPFHASPHDYRRYTHKGVKLLFPGYKIIKQFSPFGPFSLFLQCSIEITSAILSLPCKKAKPYLYIILCAFLFPIKYLDFIFARRNFLIGCAPSIFTIFKK
jgi:SAM-dependent methyltransferase